MPRILSIALVLVLLVMGLAACDKKTNDAARSGTNAIDTAELAPGGTHSTAPDTAAVAAADTAVPQAMVTHIATMFTSMGDIEFELYGKDAPKAVKNFVELARKGYYDSVAFHRVIPGFMIQTGDPNSKDKGNRESWGQGGTSIYGDSFEDELDATTPSGRRGYMTGTVAMANAGPNTNGSQFFIVASTEGAGHLSYNYTIFGLVRTGMSVVKKIEGTGSQGEKPVNPAIIKSIKITELPAPEPGQTIAAP